MKIILGIDPGSRITGYALLEFYKKEVNYIISGYIYLKNKFFFNKLKIIYDKINNIVEKYNPNYLAIEKVFIGKNANSSIKLIYAKSAVLLSLINYNIPIYEYTNTQVKKYLLKNNNNKFCNIKDIIINKFNISSNNKKDVFDALAIAITNFYDISTK